MPRATTSKAWRAENRSKPWGPPNVDTGELKRSIDYDRAKALMRRIGSGIGGYRINKVTGEYIPSYALCLEFGTRKMLPRPWLRPAVWAMKDQLKKILTTPLRA